MQRECRPLDPNYLAVCAALGIDACDVDVADVTNAVVRLVEQHDAHERLSSLLIELLQIRELEVALLRRMGSAMHGEVSAIRETLSEAMAIVDASDVSGFIARLHELTERRPIPVTGPFIPLRGAGGVL
jgi:hypothetical protein